MTATARRLALAAALTTMALAGSAGTAGAAVTVGQVAGPTQTNNCPPETALLTLTVSSGPGFTVPAPGGVITSWTTRTDASNNGTDAKLKVYRATADPDEFLVVGQSEFQPFTSPGVKGPFLTRISVQAGDWVSLLPGGNGGPCLAITSDNGDQSRVTQGAGDTPTGQNTPFFACCNLGQRGNVAAVLEPDADNDGFGDETQDACPKDRLRQQAPCTRPGQNRKCKRNRRKLKRQQRNLARAETEAKRELIQGNIEDTQRRLKRLGCT